MPDLVFDTCGVGSFELNAAIKLVIACLLGGVLGLEREVTKHPAGLRTHILVALGSAGFMLMGFFLMQNLERTVVFDPGRVAQGVITGMGFIGAGAILKEGFSIRGITTAASLWVASAVGLLVASGAFAVAAFMTAVATATLLISGRRVRDRSKKKH